VTKLGFIGTGHLASFFVEGLARAGAGYDITVSPRNAEKATALRLRFGVAIAENQEIADRCELIVVSVLPQQAEEVLGTIRFRQGQTVLSTMSGIGLATMRRLVAPADAAISMMPGLANAHDVGPSVLHPDNPVARALLEKLGPVHAYEDEQRFMAASVMGAFSGLTNLMMCDAIRWFESRGLDPADARRLVAGILKGNAETLLETPLSLDDIATGVVTPGGITEQGRKVLDKGGKLAEALDSVFARVSRRD
jgi:pyrroline-5-carboxylate reductase